MFLFLFNQFILNLFFPFGKGPTISPVCLCMFVCLCVVCLCLCMYVCVYKKIVIISIETLNGSGVIMKITKLCIKYTDCAIAPPTPELFKGTFLIDHLYGNLSKCPIRVHPRKIPYRVVGVTDIFDYSSMRWGAEICVPSFNSFNKYNLPILGFTWPYYFQPTL